MAQNITTLLDKDDITAEQIEASTSILNYLYLVHGTGSRRSRKIPLGELKKVMSKLHDVVFNSITMQKLENGVASEADFNGKKLLMKAVPAGVATSGEMSMTRHEIRFTANLSSERQDSASLTCEQLEVSGVRGGVETVSRVKYDSIYTPHLEAADSDIAGKLTSGRINSGSSKSFYEVSANSIINELLANSGIETEKGDIVFIRNTSYNTITITMGTTKTTINSLCTMGFICYDRTESQGAVYVSWSPIGNATVQPVGQV